MKKLFIFLLSICLLLPLSVYAIDNDDNDNEEINEEKEEMVTIQVVTLDECITGLVSNFKIDDKDILTVDLLSIYIPSDNKDMEEVVKTFVCGKLENAEEIKLEYDEASNIKDSLERKEISAWVFVDNELLQTMLVEEGLVNVNYTYQDYKYTQNLKESLQKAKNDEIGIWKKEEVTEQNEEKPKKKNFFQKFFDDLFDSISNFIDNLLESLLNTIESML